MVRKKDKRSFKAFREKLQEYLLEKVGEGYKLVREKVGSLSSHITLGYTMNSISEEEIEKFIDVLKGINEKFDDNGEYAEIEFDLTQGEVTQFKNMDCYIPVNPPNPASASNQTIGTPPSAP